MAMTFEELRNQLSAIEADERIYSGITASEIPFLKQLLRDKEPWLAARAVFALSTVSDPRAVAILSQTITDPRPEVRTAVAASVSKLPLQNANNILLTLLNDAALGVRKVAIDAVSGTHDALIHEKLRDLEASDPAPSIRDFSKHKLQELRLSP